MVAVGTLTILIVVGFGFIDTGQCEQQKKKRELFWESIFIQGTS